MAHKVDLIQAEIVAALRAAGCSVQSLAEVGCGVPDLLVAPCHPFGAPSANYLLECKSWNGKLTAYEAEWHNRWCGPVAVVHSVEEALRVVGVV